LVLCATSTITLAAQTFTTLHSFSPAEGALPYAGVVQGADGNFYGTTEYGGAYNGGTIFRIAPCGTLTTLHSFCAEYRCPDGGMPTATLVQARDGDFYGTTTSGGITGPFAYGGTVFRITPSGKFTTLYRFCSQSGCEDGAYPYAGLVQAADGNLYGTTVNGGNYGCYGILGCGTVFKITPDGALTTLHTFCPNNVCTDGAQPYGGLVEGTDGNFYGTTYTGGLGGANDAGTVFKMTPDGTLATLYNFCSVTVGSVCKDGLYSKATLVQAVNGDLYGTTLQSGSKGSGTVFKLTPSGTLTTLSNLPSSDSAGLAQGTDGDLYGTTVGFGANDPGTIFKITPAGVLTTLYSFCAQNGCPDGISPYAGLMQATNGDFYGTTSQGGTSNDGTVFSLSVGLGPFVETQPTSGKVGSFVKILGTDLTGVSKVTFNGTPAIFGVSSHSKVTEVTTFVPVGASNGKVQVVIPTGTLSSNVPFRVLP
jgi:uncharacterized repeat protein (TIGR03803 family)